MFKFSENELDKASKRNAIDDAFEGTDIKEKDITDTIKDEAKQSDINVNDENKKLKDMVITYADREYAVGMKVVPEHYRNVKFDENSIRKNLMEQHKKSRKAYRVYHFKDYMNVCNEIITTIRSGKVPRRSWIIGAPNGFGKSSFVNECLIMALKNGWVTVPYISLSELAEIRVAEEQRLMKPFSYEASTKFYVAEQDDYLSDKQYYIYTEGKKAHDIIKKPLIIQSAHSWSEYINAKCLFVHFTDIVSKDLESHVLYQLLSIRGAKGLPTIAMLSTSLEPYLKDMNLKEIVWNEILDYNNNDAYDRIKHVSCYKMKYLAFEKEDVADADTGILS